MKQIELQKTAIYWRLSLDDGSDGDSSSIQTQNVLVSKIHKAAVKRQLLFTNF